MNREEAIEIVRSICQTDKGKEALETLIPELRESEDERIRKAIIELLKEVEEDETYTGRQHIPDMLSYLEKQKEQRLLSIGAASEWLRSHICNYVNSEYNEFHKCVEYDGSIDKERLINDFEEAMQKEQSLRDFIDDFPYSCEQEEPDKSMEEARFPNGKFVFPKCLYARTKDNKTIDISYAPQDMTAIEYVRNDSIEQGQNHWEWREEERKILDSIIDDYEKAARSFCGYAGKIWLLKAIRDGEYDLPKQEWSEEDRLHYVNVLEALEYVKGCKSDYDKIEAVISDIAWFKSLRPQPKQETE